MGMFDHIREEAARKKKWESLIEGCKRHPGYRYKRKPTAKCTRCDELFDFYQQLKSFDEANERWWKSYHTVIQKEQEEEHRRREVWLNSPG